MNDRVFGQEYRSIQETMYSLHAMAYTSCDRESQLYTAGVNTCGLPDALHSFRETIRPQKRFWRSQIVR